MGFLHFTLDPLLIMLSVKLRGIKYHFLSFCYNSTWDWTPVSRTIGEHSTHNIYIYKDINTRLTKAWTAINRLSIIWKSDLIDKMKRSFFQAAVVSILLYGCNTWTLTKRLKKKLDGNYPRMLRAILNKSWRQHLTRHQLHGHLPPIMKTIQVRRTRHADELISDVLLWTPAYGQAKAGRSARTYIQQLCEDTGCSPEDLQKTRNDREKWRESVWDICASGTTWWWYMKDLALNDLQGLIWTPTKQNIIRSDPVYINLWKKYWISVLTWCSSRTSF